MQKETRKYTQTDCFGDPVATAPEEERPYTYCTSCGQHPTKTVNVQKAVLKSDAARKSSLHGTEEASGQSSSREIVTQSSRLAFAFHIQNESNGTRSFVRKLGSTRMACPILPHRMRRARTPLLNARIRTNTRTQTHRVCFKPRYD